MTTAPLPLPGAAPSSCSPVRSRVGRRWAMSRLDVIAGAARSVRPGSLPNPLKMRTAVPALKGEESPGLKE